MIVDKIVKENEGLHNIVFAREFEWHIIGRSSDQQCDV